MDFYKNFHKKDLIFLAAAVCMAIFIGCAAKENGISDKQNVTETVQTECQPILKNTYDTDIQFQAIDVLPQNKVEDIQEVVKVSNNIEKSTIDTPEKDTDTEVEKSKTTTTSKADSDIALKTKNPPKEYHIEVKHFAQHKDMPTGCEIVSARTVLEYYGKNVTYEHILSYMTMDNLKTTKDGKLYGKTPYQAFLGDPKKSSGFGCYPPVIINMIDNYNYNDLYAESTCGLPLDFIAKTYVTQDIPVLVWATIGMSQSHLTHSWYIEGEDGKPTKQKYTWRAEEHCLVLTGYDDKYYYFSDPLSYQEVTKYEKSLVEKRYKEVGYNSMIIRKYE